MNKWRNVSSRSESLVEIYLKDDVSWAYKQGFLNYLKWGYSEGHDNPHAPTSPKHQEFERGWNDAVFHMKLEGGWYDE